MPSSIDTNEILKTIGAVGSSLLVIITAGWAWINKNKRDKAVTEAEVASSDAAVSIAAAQEVVFNLLKDRLTTIEAEQVSIRKELAAERAMNRELVLHVYRLENLMRAAGIEPPSLTTRLTLGTHDA